MVETFGHLYGNNQVFIDGATNKSALFWKERRSISTPFCLEWLEFCKDESEGEWTLKSAAVNLFYFQAWVDQEIKTRCGQRP